LNIVGGEGGTTPLSNRASPRFLTCPSSGFLRRK